MEALQEGLARRCIHLVSYSLNDSLALQLREPDALAATGLQATAATEAITHCRQVNGMLRGKPREAKPIVRCTSQVLLARLGWQDA
jgi:hypothetical protein